MKIALLCLLVSLGYVGAGQIQSSDSLSRGWFAAYLLYAGPFAGMLLSSLLVKPRFANVCGAVSLIFLMLGVYLVFTGQNIYALPALAAAIFVPVSGATLAISLMARVFSYRSDRRRIT